MARIHTHTLSHTNTQAHTHTHTHDSAQIQFCEKPRVHVPDSEERARSSRTPDADIVYVCLLCEAVRVKPYVCVCLHACVRLLFCVVFHFSKYVGAARNRWIFIRPFASRLIRRAQQISAAPLDKNKMAYVIDRSVCARAPLTAAAAAVQRSCATFCRPVRVALLKCYTIHNSINSHLRKSPPVCVCVFVAKRDRFYRKSITCVTFCGAFRVLFVQQAIHYNLSLVANTTTRT